MSVQGNRENKPEGLSKYIKRMRTVLRRSSTKNSVSNMKDITGEAGAGNAQSTKVTNVGNNNNGNTEAYVYVSSDSLMANNDKSDRTTPQPRRAVHQTPRTDRGFALERHPTSQSPSPVRQVRPHPRTRRMEIPQRHDRPASHQTHPHARPPYLSPLPDDLWPRQNLRQLPAHSLQEVSSLPAADEEAVRAGAGGCQGDS